MEFAYTNSQLSLRLCNLKEGNGSELDEKLASLWTRGMSQGGLFRYKLQFPLPFRIVGDKYRFLLQLNPLRADKRRQPQAILSLNQPFDPNQFNFNKVQEAEVLLRLRPFWDNGQQHLLLINVSPLEFGHVLLTPFVLSNAPQRVSVGGLRLAIELLLLSSDCNFRVGFNSLCGYASVNHEHYHAYYLKYRLYLENAEVSIIENSEYYELVDYPGKGFLLILSDLEKTQQFLESATKMTEYLQKNEIAHNIFITRGSNSSNSLFSNNFDCLRLYIWARESSYGSKKCDAFNPALCELGGHFPCKTAEAYESINEKFITDLLEEICQQQFLKVRTAIANNAL